MALQYGPNKADDDNLFEATSKELNLTYENNADTPDKKTDEASSFNKCYVLLEKLPVQEFGRYLSGTEFSEPVISNNCEDNDDKFQEKSYFSGCRNEVDISNNLINISEKEINFNSENRNGDIYEGVSVEVSDGTPSKQLAVVLHKIRVSEQHNEINNCSSQSFLSFGSGKDMGSSNSGLAHNGDDIPDLMSGDYEAKLLSSDEALQDKSDGSDSGLGSEVTDDRIGKTDSLSSDDLSTPAAHELPWEPISYVSHPASGSGEMTLLHQPKSMLKRRRLQQVGTAPKRCKKSIAFGDVHVYYFPRAQGFTCVPSQVGLCCKFINLVYDKNLVENF